MSPTDVAPPRRMAARRRAQAQPYVRRSQRLGAPRSDDEDEDEDVLGQRRANGRGLFSRLFSYIPIVGKLVADNDRMASEGSDAEEEQDMGDDVEIAVETSLNDENNSAENGHTAEPVQQPSPSSPPSKRSSPAKNAPAEPVMDGGVKPFATSNVFGNGTDKSKDLKISNDKEPFAYRRMTGRRRSKPSSPTATESPLAVIKKKKPITFEEYERLSTQLRGLVETNPDNALALTRSALSIALESRASADAALVENGRDRREVSVAALPSVKRARPTDDAPIALPREERGGRKPKPSRLLTGSKRDAASRSAYSAAVAEKILSTLNKIQTPLVQEAQKPTPSTSLSWAKYQLILSKQDDGDKQLDDNMETEEVPPTSSIPKVTFKPVVMEGAPVVKKSTGTFSFTQPAPAPVSKPSAAVNGSVESSPKYFFSKPSPVQEVPVQKQQGQFSFTLPVSFDTRSDINADDDSLSFFFSPPPSMREPPKRGHKSSASKSSTAPFSLVPASPKLRPESLTKSVTPKVKSPEKTLVTSVSAPKSSIAPPPAGVNPLARFMKADDGSWRCPTCAVSNAVTATKCPCCETDKPSTISNVQSSAKKDASSSSVNPLAKFMQVEAGSWKCPTCAVTNGAKYSKCPCCDTDKPGAASVATTKTAAVDAPGSIGSGGFTFGVSSSASKKSDTPVPSGGFSVGVSADTKDKSASAAPSGFSFGVVAPSKEKDTTSGFSFGVKASPEKASTTSSTASGFTFNASATTSNSTTSAVGFSFGAQKRKASDDTPSELSQKKTVTDNTKPAVGFTFGAPSSESKEAPALPASTGFSLGSTSKPVETPEPESTKAAFTFGTGNSTAEPASKKASFTFGGASSETETKASVPSFLSTSKLTTSGEKKDVAAVSAFGSSGFSSVSKPESKPSFAFGSSAPAEMNKPAVSFGTSGSEKTEAKTSPTKAGFTFGSSSNEAKAAFTFGATPAASSSTFGASTSNDNASSASKPFAFGSASTESKDARAVSFVQPKTDEPASKKPAFSFGSAAVTSSAPATSTPAAPAFTFGGSSTDTKKTESTTAPAFTFGGSSQTASSFGSSTSSSSAFGPDKPAPLGQSTAFGSTPVASSGFSSSTTSFGGASNTSSGFGATSSTSSGFGGSTGFGFSSTAVTSAAFGSTPANTPSFGSAPTTTPGAPAFSFGSTTPSTSQAGFGFGASTSSSAFSTPTTDAFSSSQPAPFGATGSSAFGAGSQSTGFGASSTTTFGSTPAPSPAFGSSNTSSGFGASTTFGSSTIAFGTPAPSSGFGAAPAATPFGASSSAPFGGAATGFGTTPSPAPSTAFGTAPTPAFGAPTPAPAFGAPAAAAPGFGAPQGFGAAPSFGGAASAFGATDGGFAMGAAPASAPKGRRILKAKPRAKRT